MRDGREEGNVRRLEPMRREAARRGGRHIFFGGDMLVRLESLVRRTKADTNLVLERAVRLAEIDCELAYSGGHLEFVEGDGSRWAMEAWDESAECVRAEGRLPGPAGVEAESGSTPPAS